MPNYNTQMQKANLDEAAAEHHGLITKQTADLDGVSATKVTFNPGAVWSTDLKEFAGTQLCELPHVAIVTAGTIRIVMADGAQEDFSAGDVMLLPPDHDAWTIGDEACTFIEFSRGNDYYS